MRAETYDLNVLPSGTGAGTAFPAANLRDKYVQIAGVAGGGIAKIEGTINGSDWFVTGGSGSSMAADGIFAVPETYASVRVNRTTAGTGVWTVKLIGYNVGAR